MKIDTEIHLSNKARIVLFVLLFIFWWYLFNFITSFIFTSISFVIWFLISKRNLENKQEEKTNANTKLIKMSNEPIVSFKGDNGKIELYDDFVRLDRATIRGFLLQGAKGKKDIYFKNITSIQIKEPGNLPGYLQFGIHGGNESKGGYFAAAGDENTISFSGNDKYKRALKIKEYIEKKQQMKSQAFSIADEIEKLYFLFKKGALTKSEFEEKKKKLLL